MASIEVTINDKTKRGADSVNKNLSTVVDKANKASREIDGLEDSLDGMGDEAQRSGREVERLGNRMRRTGKEADGMGRAMKMAGRAFAGIGFGIMAQQMLSMADSATRMRNQLKLVTGSASELADVQNKLFKIAQSTNGGLESTTNLYARLKRSTEDLGLSQTRLLNVTETIGNAIKVSGASAQAADAALMQLGQGMASGALRGEELNSVLEQTPRLATAIADGMGVGLGELKKLGAEGEITSEKLVKAIASQQGTLREEVGKTQVTLGQAMTNLSNSLTGVISKLNDATGFTQTLANAMSDLSARMDDPGGQKTGRRGRTYQQTRGGGSGATSRIRDFFGGVDAQAQLRQSLRGQAMENLGMTDNPTSRGAIAKLNAELSRLVNQSIAIQKETAEILAKDVEVKGTGGVITNESLEGTGAYRRPRYQRSRPQPTRYESPQMIRRSAESYRKLSKSMMEQAKWSSEYKTKLDVLSKTTKERIRQEREQEKTYSDIVGHLGRLNPKLGAFGGFLQRYSNQIKNLSAGESLSSQWGKMGTADKVGFGVDAFSLGMQGLTSVLSFASNAANEYKRQITALNNAMDEGTNRGLDLVSTYFPEYIDPQQKAIFKMFEGAYDVLLNDWAGVVPTAYGSAGSVTQISGPGSQQDWGGANALIAMMEFMAKIDQGGTAFSGRGTFTDAQWRELFGTDFERLKNSIKIVFGPDATFTEVAELMIENSDAFDALRDSQKGLLDTTNQLNRATRLRFDAEEIRLRSELAQDFKRAGGDVFMQQEAYGRFQKGLTALNASSALAQSRGSGYSPEGSSANGSPSPSGKMAVNGGGGGNVTVQPTIVPITDVIKIDPSSQMVIDLGRYISIDSIALQASIATAVQEALDDRQIVT